MKTIAHLSALEEAHLLRSVLAEEGITAVVLDEGSGGHFLGTSSVFADFRVQVAEEQAESARPFVERFTGRVAAPVPADVAVAANCQRGVSVKLFQILSVALLILHFVNREVAYSDYLALPRELREALEAMGNNPDIAKFLGRFDLFIEILHGVGLLGFAALWRRARICYLAAWSWTMLLIVFGGGGESHGFPAVFYLIECLMGGFLLGVSCCPPVVGHFRSQAKQ